MDKYGGTGGGAPTGCYKCGLTGHWSRDCPFTSANGGDAARNPATVAEKGRGSAGGAATGCYKCGRPGHWSRDCPSTPIDGQNPPISSSIPTRNTTSYGNRPPLPPLRKPKQKAPRRSRPKVTPDLLLSDAGLGYIFRYFPRAFKCRGRGREVNDLRHLLGMYADWHNSLIPYFGFDQFISKVEQVGTTKRVKVCLKELRDKVADGVDPSKLHEPFSQKTSSFEQDDQRSQVPENGSENDKMVNLQEDMLEDIWTEATEEPLYSSHVDVGAGASEVIVNNTGTCEQSQITEEQKARMEANRLKALERVAARSRSLHS